MVAAAQAGVVDDGFAARAQDGAAVRGVVVACRGEGGDKRRGKGEREPERRRGKDLPGAEGVWPLQYHQQFARSFAVATRHVYTPSPTLPRVAGAGVLLKPQRTAPARQRQQASDGEKERGRGGGLPRRRDIGEVKAGELGERAQVVVEQPARGRCQHGQDEGEDGER